MVSATLDGVPPFYAIITFTILPHQRTTLPLASYSLRPFGSFGLEPDHPVSFYAVVIIGKGLAWPAPTQIQRMVSIGKPPPDQTKTTKHFCRTGKKFGRHW